MPARIKATVISSLISLLSGMISLLLKPAISSLAFFVLSAGTPAAINASYST